MKKYLLLLCIPVLVLLGINAIQLNDKTVTGQVTDETNAIFPGVNVTLKGSTKSTTTDAQGKYTISVPENGKLVFSMIGYVTQEIAVKGKTVIDVSMKTDMKALNEVVITGKVAGVVTDKKATKPSTRTRSESPKLERKDASWGYFKGDEKEEDFNTEEYDAVREVGYQDVTCKPLSTFSIDVDRASYTNIRRFINQGQMPQKDVVRIEEMVNYFTYDYKEPKTDEPFSVNTEMSACPWNEKHKLIHVGLQGKKIPTENLPASNLVFLLDVSGSMDEANKLPLVKSAMRLLVNQLREQDRVAIVVYAGAAGMVLPSTSGNQKDAIIQAMENLHAGGSTAGGQGIELAYKVAQQYFVKGGNNRVILATDGDFNIGMSSNAEMERLIEEKRQSGVFLTVLGFGTGNYKDSKMETLADKGNGNYAYIDNILEAEKVFVKEFGGTLFTIAKDVKIQVEFNPAHVKAYRLIGYENRALKDEDFNDDKKDAGELGSGHTVTALYEIIPAGSDEKVNGIDELKYQKQQINPKTSNSDEVMTVKLRYKQPDGNTSKLIEKAVKDENVSLERTSDNFRWSAAVAEFGMVLRDSEFKGKSGMVQVLALAESARGKDKEGYRAEFIRMVHSCQLLAKK
jgi:Ca-activated chloride channel family protein